MTEVRKSLTEKNRIVLKIGSSSLTHPATGELNLWKIERLVRIICDLKGEGKEVVLVSSGAIAAGRQALGGQKRPDTISEKQAYAAVGQARLMMVYQKLFSEYNCVAAQVLPAESPVGGGSVPTQLLPTFAVALPADKLSPNQAEQALRCREKPVIGRITEGRLLLDVRTIFPEDMEYIADTAAEVLA